MGPEVVLAGPAAFETGIPMVPEWRATVLELAGGALWGPWVPRIPPAQPG